MTGLNKVELAILILASKAGTVFARSKDGNGLAATYRHRSGKRGKKGKTPRNRPTSAPGMTGAIQLQN